MKKTLYSMLMLVGLLVAFTSCEKEEIENTATVEMAGEWHISVAGVTADGEIIDDDFFGDGVYNIITCNTAANVTDKMYVVDQVCYYYPYQVEVEIDPSTLTFKTTDAENLYGPGRYDAASTVTITNGKIIKNGTKTPSGMPADYIEYDITFADDPFPPYYEFDHYKVSGFRYTGFTEDE